MSGVIRISGLQAEIIIGVYDWEQDRAQPVRFDIELTTNIEAAAATDDVAHALDYDALCQGVINFAKNTRCGLLETLVSQLADWIMINFKPQRLELTLSKPLAVAVADNISLTVRRLG